MLRVLVGVLVCCAMVGCSDGPYEGSLDDLPLDKAIEVTEKERTRGYDAGVAAQCERREWIYPPAGFEEEQAAAFRAAIAKYSDPTLVRAYSDGYDEGRAAAKSVFGALQGICA